MAAENYETSRKCFYFEKVHNISGVYHKYTYRLINVLIPSCKDCAKKDSKLGFITSFLTLVIYVISVYIHSGVFAETDDVSRNWNNVLIACLPSIFIAIISFVILDFIIRIVFEPKMGIDSYCDNYSPIIKLKELGFEPRDAVPPAKYSGIKTHGPLDNNALNLTLQKIIDEDDCIVKYKD